MLGATRVRADESRCRRRRPLVGLSALTIRHGPDGALCCAVHGGTVEVAPGGAFLRRGGEMLVVLGVVLAVLLLVFWVLKGQAHR